MPEITQWQFEVNHLGRGRIIKDGVDVSDEISAVTIEMAAGHLTRVTATYRLSSVNGSVATIENGSNVEILRADE